MQRALTVQQTKVYLLLTNKKTANTFDIQRKGVRNPSQVIGQLTDLGAIISVERKTAKDDYGHLHPRIAYYTLEGLADE